MTATASSTAAERLVRHPSGFGFPALAVAAFLAVRRFTIAGAEGRAFLMSCVFIAGLLGSAFFGLYTWLLPSNSDPALGLGVESSAAPAYGLRVGLVWWILGMALVAAYFRFVYTRFGGKVDLREEGY